MRNKVTAEKAAPRLGLIASVALHAAIVAAMFVTWSHTLDIVDQSPPMVPVDLVTVADKTNVAPMVAQQPEQAPPEPNMIEPPVQPEVQPPKVEIAPQDEAKPVPKPAPPKKEQFDINNILASLSKRTPANAPPNAKVGAQTVKGIGAQNAMTADLRSMLQSEIYKCWSPPVGAPRPEKLIVSYRLFLSRDGSVAQPPQLTSDSAAAVASDPYMRAAAEAARRAIYTCAPYRLPADRYSQWSDVTFIFNPSDLMGQ